MNLWVVTAVRRCAPGIGPYKLERLIDLQMSSQYTNQELHAADRLILRRLKERPAPFHILWNIFVDNSADMGLIHGDQRLLDRRLVSLKRRGKIRFDRDIRAWVLEQRKAPHQ